MFTIIQHQMPICRSDSLTEGLFGFKVTSADSAEQPLDQHGRVQTCAGSETQKRCHISVQTIFIKFEFVVPRKTSRSTTRVTCRNITEKLITIPEKRPKTYYIH
jgi:hypothetical protein